MSRNSSFSNQLIAWHKKAGRQNLPWQSNKTPYRVWVSEIMLQQTQVKTVIPYYQRFMTHFPSVNTLANGSQETVLSLWSGLGYYSRARNLHKAAQIIQYEYEGVFPCTQEDWMKLPGIGKSTAAAILSISNKIALPILDGNVKRILCRYAMVDEWPGIKKVENKLWKLAENLMPDKECDIYTQAIMDLGALVCTRTKPQCELCPLANNCQAFEAQRVNEYPARAPKKLKPFKKQNFALILDKKNNLFLYKRPEQGIWGGLWSLPEFDSLKKIKGSLGKLKSNSKLDEIKHSFTHFHLTLQPTLFKFTDKLMPSIPLEGRWFKPEEFESLGLAKPIRDIIQRQFAQFITE